MAWVRIKTESGREVTVSAAYAASLGLEALDAPATDKRGRPLPASLAGGRRAKPKTTVSREAAKKRAAQKRPGRSPRTPSTEHDSSGVAADQPTGGTE